MIKEMIHVVCDGRDCRSELVCGAGEDATARAYKAGWWRVGDTDRCPKCARTKQVELDETVGCYLKNIEGMKK